MKDAPSPRRATYHHGDLRRALLDTALRLVAERGQEGFSLREAARLVGVSSAAAYRHFADRTALLAALAAEGHAEFAVAMEKAAERAEAPDARARAVAVLITIGRVYVEFAVKNPSLFRVMFGSAVQAPDFAAHAGHSGRDAYEILTDALDDMVSSGAIPAERRPGAEITAWATVHGFATLLMDGGLPLSVRQRADAYAVLARNLLFAVGCAPALVPEPTGWRAIVPRSGGPPTKRAR